MQHIIRFSDGPFDGVCFNSPFPIDDIIIRKEGGGCYAYECDWTDDGQDDAGNMEVRFYNMVENRFHEEEQKELNES